MTEAVKILLVVLLLVVLAVLPGLISFWQLGYSMILMFVIGLAVYFYEIRNDGG
jgi:hypothetical protein